MNRLPKQPIEIISLTPVSQGRAARHTPRTRTKGFCSVSAARTLRKEFLQVSALLEQQGDFLELAEHQPLRQDRAEIANRLVRKSRGRDQEPAEIGAHGGAFPELQGCSVVEHFLFRSVRGELSHRDLFGNFAELKHRWDGGKRFLIAPRSLRGTHYRRA